MHVQALSLGFEIDIWKAQQGAVHSCFDHAINLLVHGELWTLLGESQCDAPFGIRVDRLRALGVTSTDRVDLRAGYLRVGPSIVDCRNAARWVPAGWGTPASGLERRLALVEREAQLRAWPGSVEIASDLITALHGSDAGLARTVQRSVGRGPGLTPAGDDVLVGIFAAVTAGAHPSASRLAAALNPVLHSTSDISRHLLQQASRGLFGRALYDFGRVLFDNVSEDIVSSALTPVLDTGCTSGADACVGLAAACRLMFLPAERLAS